MDVRRPCVPNHAYWRDTHRPRKLCPKIPTNDVPKARYLDSELVRLLRNDVAEFNDWRRRNPDALVDLSDADFHNANLSGANLSGARLWRAFLNYANLSRVNAQWADFRHAELFMANLRNGDFSYARFDGADLHRIGRGGANFFEASFEGAGLPPFFNPPLPTTFYWPVEEHPPEPRDKGAAETAAEAAGAGCAFIVMVIFAIIVVGAIAGSCIGAA